MYVCMYVYVYIPVLLCTFLILLTCVVCSVSRVPLDVVASVTICVLTCE
jgi:hypothetical protein